MQLLPEAPFPLVPINHILIFLAVLVGKFSAYKEESLFLHFLCILMQFSIRSSHFYFRMPFILSLAPYSVELILPYACTGAIASYLTSSPVSLLSHILYTSSRVILLNTTFISHPHSTSPFTPHPHPPMPC